MSQYIDKSKVIEEIERIKKEECPIDTYEGRIKLFYFERFLSFINTLEVKDVDFENSVKGRIDYPLIGYDFPNIYPNYKELKFYCDKNGIKDEDRVKIIIIKDVDGINSAYGIGFLEDAKCADNHTNLTRKDIVKEVDLKKEIQSWIEDNSVNGYYQEDVYETSEHFFELGLNAQKGK